MIIRTFDSDRLSRYVTYARTSKCAAPGRTVTRQQQTIAMAIARSGRPWVHVGSYADRG
jgi:hypothetical protein